MNAQMLKKDLIADIKEMPMKDLQIVVEFVDFIKERELEAEILNNKGLVKAVKKSQKDWKMKKMTEFTPWEELKKKFGL